MVENVEQFGHRLHADALTQSKGTAQARIQIESVKACAGVAADHIVYGAGRSIAGQTNTRAARCSLDGVYTANNIEWERRVITQNAAHLEAVAQFLPGRVPRCHRRVDGGIKCQAMALIVV